MNRRFVLLGILWVAKYTGMFALSRRLMANRLRILCYHGASLSDEHEFRPSMFMTPARFRQRMEYLQRAKYSVIPLEEALHLLVEGKLPKDATTITIDDGWYGTYAIMMPILQSFRFPATLYLSTYYMEKETPVLNVALAYVLWKTRKKALYLNAVAPRAEGVLDLSTPTGRDAAGAQLLAVASELDGARDRDAFLHRVCDVLDVDTEIFTQVRALCFMNEKEAAQLSAAGIDIQLHTHRHAFVGLDKDGIAREIEDNRLSASPLTSSTLVHFCYPSGQYSREQIATLRELGIESATTCEPGLCAPEMSTYELPRFLDSNLVDQLKFEAEMSGFLELVRTLRPFR
jgi:peptidoglycan/xylan/chitin deacetylase (PgdA/CDA1 family)